MAECFFSCYQSDDDKSKRRASRAIDRQLEKDKAQYRRTVKILLLGSGESGKSTFLKQMRIIHGNHFVAEELKQFKLVIYGNIVKGMKVLIDARDKLRIPWGDRRNDKRANFIFTYDSNIKLEEPVFVQFVPALVELWKDTGIRTAFDRRREFQLVRNVITDELTVQVNNASAYRHISLSKSNNTCCGHPWIDSLST